MLKWVVGLAAAPPDPGVLQEAGQGPGVVEETHQGQSVFSLVLVRGWRIPEKPNKA